MTNEEILREIASLPKEAKRRIEDFIAFLRERYKSPPDKKTPPGNLEGDAFVGMWRNREDMQGSTAWIRSVRETHWSK